MQEIQQPLQQVETWFQCQMKQNPLVFPDIQGAISTFDNFLSDDSKISKVPWLTKEGILKGTLTTGSLVRFRAMVQDVFDPEYFAQSYQSEKGNFVSSLFTDIVQSPDDSNLTQVEEHPLGERLPVFCIPVPCEMSWNKAARKQPTSDLSSSSCEVRNPGNKRVCAELSNEVECADQQPGESTSKRLNTESEQTQQANPSPGSSSLESISKSFPIPNQEDLGCIVKLYGTDMERVFLNDMIEVVGVLHTSPMDVSYELEDSFTRMELGARRPPSSLVPRVHCISLTKCQSIAQSAPESVSEIRSQLLQSLTEVLGDTLAAQYVLLWIVSRVIRREDDMLIGSFSMGITRMEANRATSVRNLLQQILPYFQHLPMTCELLNAMPFNPCKSNDTNRLQSGRLQMCPGTHVLVDETKMLPGQLNANGVQNLKALNQLAQHQTVLYDFEYYTKDWITDMPVLVASTAKKPLVGTSCVLPLDVEPSDDSDMRSASQNLTSIRHYIQYIKTFQVNVDFKIEEPLISQIEQQFISFRQKYNELVNAETLHMWLNMARLWEYSMGNFQNVTDAGLGAILKMERERIQRVHDVS